MDAILTALITSVLGTVRLSVVLLAGFLASKFPPLLTKDTCRCISRVCALLFWPALMTAGTGATLTPGTLQDAWQLVVTGSFTIGFSGVVAWLVGRVSFQRPEDRRAFRPAALAIAFPNSAGFPLLLVDALCEQDYINRWPTQNTKLFDNVLLWRGVETTGLYIATCELAPRPAACSHTLRRQGFSFHGYGQILQVWFYSWGFYALGQDDELERKLAGEEAKIPSEATTDDVEISSPCEIAQGDALPPLQADGGSGMQSPIHDGAVIVGASRRNEGVSGTGGTAVASHAGEDGDDAGCFSWAGLRRRLWRLAVSPNMIAVAIGVIIAMLPALQELLFDSPRAVLRPFGAAIEVGHCSLAATPVAIEQGTIGSPTVAVSTLVMAGSLVQVPTVGAGSAAATQGVQCDDDGTLRRWRRFRIVVGFLHVVCRLIVGEHADPRAARFKDYLHGPMDAGTKLKVKFRTGDIGLRERRRRHRTVDEEDDEFKCDCGFECEDRVHVVAECPLYKKEREVYVTELGKIDGTYREMFEAWNREERTVAVVGHRRWVEKAGRDIVRIDRLGKTFLSHLWQSRKERLAIGDRSCGNNAPSSRGRVVPAVGFTLFWVARNQSSVMGENRLMHLILLIELAMPSAAFVIVSLNQLRMPATAGFMARLYLWQYGASMLTITAWTALAVHLVY
ncbi:unnamed protein product [Ectocarpus sp. CCAP 1310/34]|nr:unnamed protein product [Ectocarpus sp. CCAP 1310/34]